MTNGFPPLSGWPLWTFRICWSLLALGSLITLGWLACVPTTASAILMLRLCKGVVLVTVAAILFRRRQRDLVAALLSSAFLLWTITSSFSFSSSDMVVAIALADRLRFLLFALALLLFPTGDWSPHWTRSAAIASFCVFAIGTAETLGLISTTLFLPLAIGCVLVALAALILRYRRLGDSAERQQLKWVAFGLSCGILLILGARAAVAVSLPLPGPFLEGLFQSGVIVLALGFLVSLLRYRLYDAEAFISRSAAYAALTLSLIATFTASEVLIENLGQNYLGSEIGNLAGALAAGVAAMLLAPLHDRISQWAERRFQRDLSALKVNLPELLAELSGVSSLARVAEVALPRIDEALHTTGSALIIDGELVAANGLDAGKICNWSETRLDMDSREPLNRETGSEIGLRMPLHCPFGTIRGWLVLGPRPDGSNYSGDDLEALAEVSKPLRTALFAAREREIERQADHSEQQLLKATLRSLSARLAKLEQKSRLAQGSR